MSIESKVEITITGHDAWAGMGKTPDETTEEFSKRLEETKGKMFLRAGIMQHQGSAMPDVHFMQTEFFDPKNVDYEHVLLAFMQETIHTLQIDIDNKLHNYKTQ